MLLIQLSDLHIGGNYFRQEIFDTIVYEVKNKLKPDDAILITGDLTDDGLISQFRRASIEIKKLTDVCPNVIILPGIHDYRHTGHLLFKKFFSSYSSYPSSVHRFDKIIILTLATARPNRDEGEVGHQQNLWLEEKLRNEQCKYMTIRIIAMHHHLVGVLDTGTDKIVIVDAGDILRTCLHHDVDLVLCGHKHRPWLWNLETMDIVYAGTASSTRFRGFPKNTYNTLDIKSNGKVSFDLKIVGGERIPLANLARKQKGKLEI